jgi:hypothetical protein
MKCKSHLLLSISRRLKCGIDFKMCRHQTLPGKQPTCRTSILPPTCTKTLSLATQQGGQNSDLGSHAKWAMQNGREVIRIFLRIIQFSVTAPRWPEAPPPPTSKLLLRQWVTQCWSRTWGCRITDTYLHNQNALPVHSQTSSTYQTISYSCDSGMVLLVSFFIRMLMEMFWFALKKILCLTEPHLCSCQ